MTTSILTNAGALVALRTLEQTTRGLQDTQNRISTGLKVQNAKDNASFWAVSTVMRSDVNAFKAIGDNLSLASNSTSVARDGAQNITKLIDEIKSKTTSAQEGSIDKKKLQADIDASLSQIGEIVKSAQFNGVNLLSDDKSVKLLSSIARNGTDATASFIEFSAQNLSLEEGGGLSALAGISVLDRGDGLLTNKSDGTVQLTTASVAGANGAGANTGEAGEKVTFKYEDEKGVARTVSITLEEDLDGTATKLAEVLSENKQISKLFDISADSTDTKLVINAKRDSGVSYTSVDVGDGSVVGATQTNAVGSVNSASMEFKDAPLRMGESFTYDFGIGATDKFKLSFKVVDGERTSGDILSASQDENDVYHLTLALDSRQVTTENTKGSDIASQMKAALDNFDSATYSAVTQPVLAKFADAVGAGAATATSLGFSATDSTFALTTTGTTADNQKLTAVKVPETDYQALLDTIEGAMQTAVDAATTFGSAQKRVDVQKDFVKSLVDNLTVGIGTLVDANMQEESARLQALQVQQQLGVQALSMANQAPQTLLSLFR